MQATSREVVGIGRAGDLLPDLDGRTLLHAGPPIGWADMCGPLRGAIIRAAVHEGIAADPRRRPGWPSGARSCASAPATTAAPSAPWPGWSAPPCRCGSSRTAPRGTAPSAPQRGPGQGTPLRRLRHRGARPAGLDAGRPGQGPGRRPGPAGRAARPPGPDRPGPQMGDGSLARNRAGTSLLLQALLSPADRRGADQRRGRRRRVRLGNDRLPQPGHGRRQGRRRGRRDRRRLGDRDRHGPQRHRVRGAPGRHRRPLVHRAGRGGRRALPAGSVEDANRDIGDSTITETIGIGGMAMAAAPAIVRFVGGTPDDAVRRHPVHVRHHLGRERLLPAPRPRFPRHPLGIDCRESSTPGSSPPSTPASPTRTRASARSAPAWSNPPWRRSSPPPRAGRHPVEAEPGSGRRQASGRSVSGRDQARDRPPVPGRPRSQDAG